MRKHTNAHKGGCNYVVFSPSGNYVASGGQDGVIRIWLSDDGSLLTELTPPNAHTAASINGVQFSEDKGVVMAASNDKSISVWDFYTGRQRFTMTGLLTVSCSHKEPPPSIIRIHYLDECWSTCSGETDENRSSLSMFQLQATQTLCLGFASTRVCQVLCSLAAQTG